MPRVRQPVPNMIGGVSQQTDASRSPDACAVMENSWPSPVDGLTKRQPSNWLAELYASTSSSWKWHFIDRSATEKYAIVFKDGDIDAFDLLTGQSRVVRDIPATSFAYISGLTNNAKEDLDVLTVADFTFVANKNTPVAMAGTTSAAEPTYKAYIFLRQGNYSTTYTVRVNPNGGAAEQFSITTWDGNTAIAGSSATPAWPAPTELNSIKTEDIAEQIRLGIENMTGTWTANRPQASGATPVTTGIGSIIEIDYTSGTFDSIDAGDSVGDSVLSVVHKEVPRVAGYLPETCRNGFKVKVVGDAEIDADEYYVEFVADEGGTVFGPGTWREAVGYGEETSFDGTTMPHTLVRRFDDAGGTITGTPFQAYFDWDLGTWDSKITGDSVLVPRPSFVGKSISDLAYFKRRLTFLADDRVNMSETGEPFNFWRTTLFTLRDTAPIDHVVNHTPVALLTQAVEYNEALLLKSGRSQFILRGADILSPRTIEVTPVSEFESYADRDFIPAGRSVFFPFARGSQSGIKEFFQFGDSQTYDAVDVTVQVPNYIEGKIDWIAISTLEETLVVKSAGSANTLYIYKYVWSGNTKVISSWGKWTFDSLAEVLAGHFVDNKLYLVVEYADNNEIALETLDIATGLTDAGSQYVTLLDRRVDETQVSGITYDTINDQTTFTLPYDHGNSEVQVVEKATGLRLEVVSAPDPDTVTVRGDLSAKNFWCGVKYTSLYQFSTPLLRLPAGRGQVPVSGQRTNAQKLDIEYHNSGLFKITTQIGRRSLYTKEIAGPQPDFSSTVVGSVELKTGSDGVGVRGRSTEAVVQIINDGPYPSNITSAEWTLFTHPRGARLPS